MSDPSIEEFVKQVEILKEELAEEKSINKSLRLDIGSMEREIRQLEQENEELRFSKDVDVRSLEGQMENLQFEKDELESDLEDKAEENSELRDRIIDLQEQVSSLEDEIGDLKLNKDG